MQIKFLSDAASGHIDEGIALLCFVLACMFTLMLAIVLGEENCEACGHTNYQHDDAGCGGKDNMGSYGVADCKCKGYRKAKSHA